MISTPAPLRTPSACATIPRTRPSWQPSPRRWTRSVCGDVYRLRAAKNARGHEQKGMRYAVELQGPILLSTVIAAPTSTRAAPAVFRPDIDLGGTTTKVLVDQMAAVDGELRLGVMVLSLIHI